VRHRQCSGLRLSVRAICNCNSRPVARSRGGRADYWPSAQAESTSSCICDTVDMGLAGSGKRGRDFTLHRAKHNAWTALWREGHSQRYRASLQLTHKAMHFLPASTAYTRLVKRPVCPSATCHGHRAKCHYSCDAEPQFLHDRLLCSASLPHRILQQLILLAHDRVSATPSHWPHLTLWRVR
jgi:hypothetical protein